MGMGEPLYNFDNVAAALKIVMDPEGLAISRRKITLSTAGVVPMIARVGAELGVNLAVSLHAVSDDLRDRLVPLNRKYPIAELLDACRRYPGSSNARRITFEYVMLKGVNDSPAEARELVRLLRGIPAKVNLIPFNPWPGAPYECSDRRGDRGVLRHRLCRRLFGAGQDAARARHPRRLRPAQIGERAAASRGAGGGRSTAAGLKRRVAATPVRPRADLARRRPAGRLPGDPGLSLCVSAPAPVFPRQIASVSGRIAAARRARGGAANGGRAVALILVPAAAAMADPPSPISTAMAATSPIEPIG